MSELTKALIKAKAEFAPIKRKAEVKVKTKSGGEYSFKYAPMDEMKDATEKPLSDNGLLVVSVRDGDVLVTRLMHISGETLESRSNMRIRDGASQQDEGSVRSYQERYNYAGILGLCAADDDDANIADGNAFKRKPAKTTPPKKRTPEEIHAGFIETVNKLAETLGDDKTSVILRTYANTENLAKITNQKVMIDIVADMKNNIEAMEKETNNA